ncbi:3'-5' exonuclease [Micromonospora aurantiaca (nom. illeg.)]|uniref:3'-5' exonuclease n=1 Tax=Micromonospora aurantiaca (nom. illeg.) TaxID=47850 RepID=UPI0016572656|nr:hypothetical protein [Micromonospora aurantiaca]MBC9006123.1 hypothetical protein [Micromonospora aurantiaca]
MTATIVALDLETTGLDPGRHHIWEIGAVVRGRRDPAFDGEWHIMMRPNLAEADPEALRIGRYYERATPYVGGGAASPTDYLIAGPHTCVKWLGETSRPTVARWLAWILGSATIVGANPAFDATFMARFLRAHGQAPTWHHHLVDVAALTAGYLAGQRDGFNASVDWLADYHNHRAGESGVSCTVQPPDLDTAHLMRPPWRTSELATRLGVVCPPEQRHTALGDARWALAIYDRIMTTPAEGGQRG